ncbi:GNAT family N-acetyltransferase [Bradyrhizobium sp. 180]|uniref:GNAT family N-acetyltransferase n=1 Tax=unclassified Bradyrhizobium TaxID=2631580 RepID=UPI001FFAE4B8|nr:MULTISPECIES: GNAT family N-acetyltransferase [unclassified Bradyrhizobium]MCK1422559.1 GNAT family N-acetyltransferase [Bradyrhizobium sp. CW12]MCK1493802.1 GNAT family N-acetyltransferase [Bradyrhizobium sp. 180]MCK1529310.1 GNAT family N-acetyltransferase [Bradyrhizobium sp. 182]MCK1598343.1 GNAT family N-acetyltransferase [Bradyrhizobium sp. 164]MCK1619319.1 GNAT family N-acetyltransferase [Bradyrhizobium sp. 159]
MSTLRLEDLRQYSDTLRTREGETFKLRFVEPRDTEELQHYFRSLSTRSRYNRFFGAISELPKGLLHDFLDVGERERFTVVATMMVDGFETIVAEMRYALHAETAAVEFGLSVDDRWHGHGIATALLKNLECRAAALGAEHIFGETLRSNETMISLARKSGFAFVNHPDDWKLVRFDKKIAVAPKDIPCASWRLAALSRQADSPSASA